MIPFPPTFLNCQKTEKSIVHRAAEKTLPHVKLGERLWLRRSPVIWDNTHTALSFWMLQPASQTCLVNFAGQCWGPCPPFLYFGVIAYLGVPRILTSMSWMNSTVCNYIPLIKQLLYSLSPSPPRGGCPSVLGKMISIYVVNSMRR